MDDGCEMEQPTEEMKMWLWGHGAGQEGGGELTEEFEGDG